MFVVTERKRLHSLDEMQATRRSLFKTLYMRFFSRRNYCNFTIFFAAKIHQEIMDHCEPSTSGLNETAVSVSVGGVCEIILSLLIFRLKAPTGPRGRVQLRRCLMTPMDVMSFSNTWRNTTNTTHLLQHIFTTRTEHLPACRNLSVVGFLALLHFISISIRSFVMIYTDNESR